MMPSGDQHLDDLRHLLAQPAGRRVLSQILQHCGMDAVSHCADPHQTAFNEGRRSVGVRLVRELRRADFEAYLTMMRLEQES